MTTHPIQNGEAQLQLSDELLVTVEVIGSVEDNGTWYYSLLIPATGNNAGNIECVNVHQQHVIGKEQKH